MRISESVIGMCCVIATGVSFNDNALFEQCVVIETAEEITDQEIAESVKWCAFITNADDNLVKEWMP